MLGLGNCDVQVLTAYPEGGEEGAVWPLQEANFLIDRKIVLGLGNFGVQVLTAYPGKEVKKVLSELCRRLILIWQENCAVTWQL